jgi:hypothetical protein
MSKRGLAVEEAHGTSLVRSLSKREKDRDCVVILAPMYQTVAFTKHTA